MWTDQWSKKPLTTGLFRFLSPISHRAVRASGGVFFGVLTPQSRGIESEMEKSQAQPTARRITNPRGVLTDRAVDAAKPRDKDYKLTDGNSLFLLVRVNGTKLWRFKYYFAGREKAMALGQYPEVRLAVARQKRDEARDLIVSGHDPMHVRKVTKAAQRISAANSFRSVAEVWWKSWSQGKSDQHAGQVWRRFEQNVFGAIGGRPIDQIEAPELVAMMKALEGRKVIDLAKRALQTTSQVFRYAIAHGLAHRNPAADIRPADVLPAVTKRNLARIDAKQLPDLLRHIEAYQGTPLTRLALKLIALTFVRTTELIEARWDEFDLNRGVWTIPAERMKMKTPHIVPLSRQTVDVLRTLHLLSGERALLFPGERDHAKPMSNNTILGALKRMGYKGQMTGHGFRGLASTVLHEHGFEHAHIELQLAHQERNQVSAAYNHATYVKQRADMMQWWADHLDSCRNGNVVPLHRFAA
jgi:integrase